MSRPELRRRPGAKALVVGFGLLLAGLLALVALASGGDLGGDGARGDGAALPSGGFAYLYALFLTLGVLAIPLFVVLYARETPFSAARRRRARLAPLFVLGFLALLLAIVSRWPETFSAVLERIRLRDPGDAAGGGRHPAEPPAPEATPLAVVWSTVVGVIALAFLYRLLRPHRSLAPLPALAEALTVTLDETLDDLRGEPDPRRAIVLAYGRMERTLRESGVPRRESEAPLEYLSRVLLELDLRSGPVARLTDLFEQARFSDHPIGPELKQDAIEALEELRADLRALA